MTSTGCRVPFDEYRKKGWDYTFSQIRGIGLWGDEVPFRTMMKLSLRYTTKDI